MFEGRRFASFVASLKARSDNSNSAATCGQSYKRFMLVMYDSRVVIWGIFKSGMPLGSQFPSVKCL